MKTGTPVILLHCRMEDFLKPYMDRGLLYPADTPESVIEKIRGILDVSLTRQPG